MELEGWGDEEDLEGDERKKKYVIRIYYIKILFLLKIKLKVKIYWIKIIIEKYKVVIVISISYVE